MMRPSYRWLAVLPGFLLAVSLAGPGAAADQLVSETPSSQATSLVTESLAVTEPVSLETSSAAPPVETLVTEASPVSSPAVTEAAQTETSTAADTTSSPVTSASVTALATGSAETLSVESNAMIAVPEVWERKVKGEGTVVAVIDSGLDVEHDVLRITDMTKAKYQSEEAFAAVKEAAGISYGTWFNDKVIFGYNYTDVNDQLKETKEDSHGMHVSGIAVGNPSKIDSSGNYVYGVAPEAQLMFMRVFSDTVAGTSPFLYVRAIEDAVKLGADSINLSLGSANGSMIDAGNTLSAAIAAAQAAGVTVVIAAGNDTVFGEGHSNPDSDKPDYGVVANPAVAKDSIAVASVNNSHSTYEVFAVSGQETNATLNNGNIRFSRPTDGQRDFTKGVDYALVVAGLGKKEELENLDLTGKVALIKRGEITFAEKINNAKAKGAVGVIVYNNRAETAVMQLSNLPASLVPSVFVEQAIGEELVKLAGTATIRFDGKFEVKPNPDGNLMSDFTSWGLSADGELKPDVTAPGGAIYSAINNNKYASMNGTSMAAPHVAGLVALMKQALTEKYPNMTGTEMTQLIKKLLMSTALPHFDTSTNAYTSPRRQGAGIVNAERAIDGTIYVTGDDAYPSLSLGNVGDEFTFNVTLTNLSDVDRALTYVTHVNTDTVEDGKITLKPRELAKQIGASIIVPALGSLTIPITVNAAAFADELRKSMTKGYYLEGFVRFLDAANAETEVASIPYVGFRGDFQDLPVIEKSIYDFAEGELPFYYVPAADYLPNELNQSDNDNYTSLITGAAEWDHIAGDNGVAKPIVLGTFENADGKFIYEKAENGKPYLAISPNGDNNRDALAFRGVFLRNFSDFKATVYAADDVNRENPLWQSTPESGGKNFYSGQASNPKSHIIFSTEWNGTDKDGKDLPDGTYQFVLTYLPDVPGAKEQSQSYDIIVDRVKPAITTAVFDEETMTFDPRSPLMYGSPLYRERVYYVVEPAEGEETVDPITGLKTTAKGRRVYITPNEDGSYTLPLEDEDGNELEPSRFWYAVEDKAGNTISTNVTELIAIGNDKGLVGIRVVDQSTQQDYPAGFRYVIKDAEGNILEEAEKFGGAQSTMHMLPFGSYTAELFIYDRDYATLVGKDVISFEVTEDNTLQAVDFVVESIKLASLRVSFDDKLPTGTKVYVVDAKGNKIELPLAKYVPNVFERKVASKDYTIEVVLPAGYKASENQIAYTVLEGLQNIKALYLTAKGDLTAEGAALSIEEVALPTLDLTSDEDGDGFSLLEEIQAGTDWTDVYSVPEVTAKGDSLAIAAPVLPTLDLTSDEDGDGFSLLEEIQAGTDWTDVYSVPEVTAKLVAPADIADKPVLDLTSDEDGDGFSLLEEIQAGTDWTDVYSVPEVTAKLVAPVYTADKPVLDLTSDEDGDGFTLLEEIQAGTDWTDSYSVPEVTGKLVAPAYIADKPVFELASLTKSESPALFETSPRQAAETRTAKTLPNTGQAESILALLGLGLVSLSLAWFGKKSYA